MSGTGPEVKRGASARRGSHTAGNGTPGTGWDALAPELATWAWERMVNRTDVWGGYHPLSERGKEYTTRSGEVKKLGAPTTRPVKRLRGTEQLTPSILECHFRATAPENVVGLHTTSPRNTCRWGALEVDWHGPESTNPKVNYLAALGWYDQLRRLGFDPLLTDSNGKGGFHLLVMLADEAPAVQVFNFLRWLVKDHADRGLPNRPETFPKQRAVPEGKYGNWLRLPGLHHTRPHWSRVWDGKTWLEGQAAAEHILALGRSAVHLLYSHRIEAYIAKLPNLGEAQGRDDVAYNLLAFLARDLELPDDVSLEWAGRWDAGNRPPKGAARLKEILASVHLYGQRAYGSGRDRQTTGSTARPASSSGEPWEPPIPFSEFPRPAFPAERLPVWMREYVLALAEHTQTPPDLAAMLALGVAGAGLAGKVRASPRPGYTEPLNIYPVVALPPGNRKSAVFDGVFGPVQEHEQELVERERPRVAEAQSERRALEARLKHTEAKAAKTEDAAERGQMRHAARQLARELAETPVPVLPQLYADDVTPEKLAGLLAEQGGRMLVASAEGTIFEIIAGRYSESPNFDVFLKGHAGDPLRVHRIGREAEYVDKPALSLAVAVQPDVIAGLASNASLRGRGLLARLLYSLPVSRVGNRTARPAPVPFAVAQDYHDGMQKLWKLQPPKPPPPKVSGFVCRMRAVSCASTPTPTPCCSNWSNGWSRCSATVANSKRSRIGPQNW